MLIIFTVRCVPKLAATNRRRRNASAEMLHSRNCCQWTIFAISVLCKPFLLPRKTNIHNSVLFSSQVEMNHTIYSTDGVQFVNVLSMALRFKRTTIAEELLRMNPTLLCSADLDAIMDCIRDNVTFLEYLNQTDGEDCQVQQTFEEVISVSNSNAVSIQTSTPETTAHPKLTDLWTNFVRQNHSRMLSYGDECTLQIIHIYDYFVHCVWKNTRLSHSCMNFSIFKEFSAKEVRIVKLHSDCSGESAFPNWWSVI